nr:peptide ABC transporter substrate-binding protein [uncultured Dysosmobacter sp.]
MPRFKRLAALLLPAALCVSMLAGCSKAGEGLSLSVCAGAALETLDPIYAESTGDQTILVHLYENLMRVTADGSGSTAVVPGMAKSVDQEENHDGTVTYTFRLRSAKWSDGQSVKASDFVYAWQRLADPASHSPYAELLSVVSGYDEARVAGDMELLQVSAKNDTTLVVVLNGTYDWFLKEVCTSPATMPLRKDVVQRLKSVAVQSSEDTDAAADPWWADPTALVTNGPYLATGYEVGMSLTVSANERYYGDQNGPRDLTFHFADAAEAEMLYEGKTVDAVCTLTEERLAELAADENWSAVPELGAYTVLFNCRQDLFSDVLIRQAMNLAVDRNALAQIAGVTARAAEGLVPSGVPENETGDFRAVGGALLDNDPETYDDRCAQAKALLEEAGYDRGTDLGQLEYLYVDEGTNGLVALALCQQWQDVLAIQVTPRGMTEQELWAALRTGDYMLAGVDLDAAGNDAECFLMDWTSDSQDNVVGYENSAYDTLMTIIANAADGTARMGCLHDAEELLLMDDVLGPLYTRGTAWELRDGLTGAFRDARGWFCFSGVMTRTT